MASLGAMASALAELQKRFLGDAAKREATDEPKDPSAVPVGGNFRAKWLGQDHMQWAASLAAAGLGKGPEKPMAPAPPAAAGHDDDDEEEEDVLSDSDGDGLSHERAHRLEELREMQLSSQDRYKEFVKELSSVSKWLDKADLEEAVDEDRAEGLGLPHRHKKEQKKGGGRKARDSDGSESEASGSLSGSDDEESAATAAKAKAAKAEAAAEFADPSFDPTELVGKLADGREKLTGIGAQMLSVVQEVAAERDTLRHEARLASSRAESERRAALANMELQVCRLCRPTDATCGCSTLAWRLFGCDHVATLLLHSRGSYTLLTATHH